ncbi:MAG TPA: ABC transporter permease [Actinomycetota bacterium]|nr:ABC transporter permease [Actinomycetota bacterium]
MVEVAPRLPQAAGDDRFAGLVTRVRRIRGLVAEAMKSPTTVAGATIVVALIAMALFAPLLMEPNRPDPYQMPRDWSAVNQPPGSPGHVLGTTPEGGDVLYGIVWGARTSLRLALIVVTVTVVVGVIVGSLAGYLGGRWDEWLMRFVDIFLAVPEMVLALAIAAILGPSFRNIIFAIALLGWPKYARIVRGQIIHLKKNEYVDAATVMGDSRLRIYLKDILPNAMTPVVVQATLSAGQVVLFGATLSFIGLAEAGLAEWGNLVSEGQSGIVAGRWWVATFGGAMVFLWSLGFNLLGDGLRDVLDPRTEGR